jgi:hypothetical protein
MSRPALSEQRSRGGQRSGRIRQQVWVGLRDYVRARRTCQRRRRRPFQTRDAIADSSQNSLPTQRAKRGQRQGSLFDSPDQVLAGSLRTGPNPPFLAKPSVKQTGRICR